jgi:hypothetical protein
VGGSGNRTYGTYRTYLETNHGTTSSIRDWRSHLEGSVKRRYATRGIRDTQRGDARLSAVCIADN